MNTRAQRRGFWLRWVGANALPEMIGLGVAGLVGVQVFAAGPANLGGDRFAARELTIEAPLPIPDAPCGTLGLCHTN